MKPKIHFRQIAERLTGTLRESPAETLLALYAFTFCALIREKIVTTHNEYPLLLPIFFALALVANRWCRSPRSRIIYYLSPLAAIPLLWVDAEAWVRTPGYPVTLAVCVLVLLASCRKSDNESFVRRALYYIGDLAASGLIALAGLLASLAIFFSVVYIFNVFKGYEEDVLYYAATAASLVVWPVLFLTLDRESEHREGAEDRPAGPVLDVLMNYVLTPAVLIYTLILYLYFGKIAWTWSLPKGGIAYLVFGYAAVALLTQAAQPLLRQRRYDWYYAHFGAFSLPALVMFWIGVAYRIQQYGFTQSRVYLAVCGAIMTVTVILFLSRRTGRYLYATVTAAALLALFTYIPGISAADIGIRSQAERAENLISRLGLADRAGQLSLADRPGTDSIDREGYRQLYESLEYLGERRGSEYLKKHYGISRKDELLQVVPDSLRTFVEYGWSDSQDDTPSYTLSTKGPDVGIGDYRTLHPVTSYSSDRGGRYRCSGDTLYIEQSDGRTVLAQSLRDMLDAQLAGTGFRRLDRVPADSLKAWSPRLGEYRLDSVKLVFDHLVFERTPELRITDLGMDYYLTR